MSVARTLEETTSALSSAGVNYAIMGGLAAMAWGRPRTTLDVDIVVDAEASLVRSALVRLAYSEGRCIGPLDTPDFTQFWSSSGTRLDVFFARTDFEKEALARAVLTTIGALSIRTVSADCSVIYKLIAHRGRDLDDVEAIMLARARDLDWVFIERCAVEWELEAWLHPFRARYKPV